MGQDNFDAQKSENVTLKWNVFNPKVDSIYKLYFKDNKKQTSIGSSHVQVTNGPNKLSIDSTIHDSPFTKRTSGRLDLINGIGTLEITINNLQYTDSGVIIVENIYGPVLKAKGNTTLIVNGM